MLSTKLVGKYKKMQYRELDIGDFFVRDDDPDGKVCIRIKGVTFPYTVDGREFKTIKNYFDIEEAQLGFAMHTSTVFKLGGRIEVLLPVE